MSASNKTVIVTGYAGTIGPALCERFLEEGYNVIGVDSLVEPHFKVSEEHALDYCSWLENYYKGRFLCIQQDAQKLELQDIYCQIRHQNLDPRLMHTITHVLHFGSPASPPQYKIMPLYTMASNIDATKHLLSLSQFVGARFIFASTSEVYGSLDKDSFKEDDKGLVNSYGHRACYDEGKRAGETLCFLAHQGGSDCGLVRIFNTYSEFMNPVDGRVISSFVYNLMDEKPIQIYGNGKQTRSFMHVDDLVEGVFKYSVSNLYEPVNLGNPTEYYSVNDVAYMVGEVLGHGKEWMDKFAIERARLPDEDDPPVRRPNITRARELLGWNPSVTLKEGLVQVVRKLQTWRAECNQIAE